MHQEQFELLVLEAGPPVELELSWLHDRHPDAPGDRPERSRRGRRRRGGRGRDADGETGTADDAESLDALGDEVEDALGSVEALDDGIEADDEAGPASERSPDQIEPVRDAGFASAPPQALADASDSGLGGAPQAAEAPGAEASSSSQPVDGEVESRIIPRSE
jgi:ribonuclease E